MRSENNKFRTLTALALFATVCALSAPAFAQDAALPDTAIARAGLDQLPSDLRARWLSLSSLVDVEHFKDYITEGNLTIKQLGELILAVGGTPPSPDQPSYAVYAELQGKLISILDRIELAMIANMPDETLGKLLDRYRGEKDDLSILSRQDRTRLIEEGSRLIKSHENDPYFKKYPHRRIVLAELYFRLTELLYAEAYDSFLEETDKYLRDLDEMRKNNTQGGTPLAQPQPDYSRVMAMYQRIVDEFPISDYADDALYNLGILTATGETASDRTAANKLFETLVRIYPDSEYKLNCLRRIGEYYFNPPINNLTQAINIYEQIVAEYPKSEYYAEALYKLGWCHYRLSDLPTAVESFARSLDAGYAGDAVETEQSGFDIATESINYIGVCYAVDPREWKSAGVDSMIAWLHAHPVRMEKYGRRVVQQLGEIYHKQVGRHADAVVVYGKYQEVWPLDSRIPTILGTVVEIYQQGEIYNPQAAHSEKARYYRQLNPDSEWWRVNTDQRLRESITPTLERYLDMLIDETLVLATDSKDPTLYDGFIGYSRQYLRFWPKGPHAYKIHFNLASVLEKRPGREVEALREYWQVATGYADTTQRDISTQRVVAIAQGLLKRERDGEIALTDAGDVAPPAPPAPPKAAAPADSADSKTPKVERTQLLNSERLILAGFDLHLKFTPASQFAPTMLYQAGDILYQHEWFPESRVYLEKLIAEQPGHKYVEDSYKLILEGFFKSGQYADVEATAGKILASNASKETKDIAKKRKAESTFLAASSLKEGNDHKAAAAEFKRVALDNPDYQYADRSLFQAGLEFMQAGEYKEANEVFLIIADKYPQSEYGDKAIYNAGFNLQSQLKDLAGAAQLYERLVKSYPKSDLAQGALSNASENYNKLEDHRAAIRVNTLYTQLYPTADDASVYLFENASHHFKLNEPDKANEIYRQFAQRYPEDPRTVQAVFERGKFALGKGDKATASKEFTATLDAHQKLVARGTPGSPRYASQALEHLLIWEQEEYQKIRFTGTEAQVKAAKDRKKQWRNSLVDKYQGLIRLGQKEAYRAFYAIGRLDEDFALATYQQDIPPAKDQQGRIDNLSKSIDEAILLNTVAQQSFKMGYDGLRQVIEPLRQERDRQRSNFTSYSALTAQLQKDTLAVGVADSLSKLSAMQKVVAELDSAVVEAMVWTDSCRQKIPATAIKNGQYLSKLWYANFNVRSTDKDEEVRMLFREEAVKNVIAPMAPEIVVLYMQAWNAAREAGLGSKWRKAVEQGYQVTIDSLAKHYIEQISLARKRVDDHVADFDGLLLKGPDARSKKGFYSDELGGIILDQVDYLDAFTMDMVDGYRVLLDTLAAYKPPYGFGEAANDWMLDYLTDQSDGFGARSADAAKRKAQYEDKYNETSDLKWDDAGVAYEDIGLNCKDYSLAILEAGLDLRTKYAISGPAGIALVEKIVTLDPDKYGPLVGLTSETVTVTTDASWKVWPSLEDGYEQADFDDFDWLNATPGGFPAGSAFGVLDSIGSQPIWFNMEKPTPTMGVAPLSSPDRMALNNLVRQIEPTADTPDTTGSDSLDWVEEVEEQPAEEAAEDTLSTPAEEPAVEESPAVEEPAESPAAEPPAEPVAAPVEETPPPAATEQPPTEEPVVPPTEETGTPAETPAAESPVPEEPAPAQELEESVPETQGEETPAETVEPTREEETPPAGETTDEPASDASQAETAPAETTPVEAPPVETAPVETAPVEAAPVEVAAPAPAPVPAVSAEADSIYRAWMLPDSTGARKYYFRKTFNIAQQPTSGRIWATCDDDYILHVNGSYAGEDKHESEDWNLWDDNGVLELLKVGRNVIAIEATDINNTRYGLLAGLVYEFVPDMNLQIATLKDRENERDRRLKDAADKRLMEEEAATVAALTAGKPAQEVQAAAEAATEKAVEAALVEEKAPPAPPKPTELQLRDMRTIEKNKLR